VTSHDQTDKTGGIGGRKPYRIVGTAVLVAALVLVVVWFRVVRGGQDPASAVETFVARRGPLTISVLEAGTLKAKDPAIIRSSLPRRATIISIIPEGTRVKEGDLLVELDVSTLVDHCLDHKIMVQNAEAAWINAREALVITKSLAQSSVELARLNYEFAQQDLEKYEKGQYPNTLAAAEGKIKLNQEEKEKAGDYLVWSQKLHAEKYLSDTQLQADELSLSRADLNLEVANNDLKLLQEYTYHRQTAQLTSDVNQTKMALERAEARARANIAQAEAHLAAREQEYQHQQEMLARHEDEVSRAKIYAPTDGMVIYATSSQDNGYQNDRRPLADGVDVWDRQELIYLPRSTSTIAEVAVHEANLQKVRVGLPAIVTVDALPGKKLMGTVAKIAPLPDSRSMWMNPDLKIYKTEIALDSNDPSLRSGMNCRAEIIVEQYAEALYVPIQTVQRIGGQSAVHVLDHSGDVAERRIETGLDDNTVVRVVRGLEAGELVVLTPPARAEGGEPGARGAGIRGADTNEMSQQINEKLKAADKPMPQWRGGGTQPKGRAPQKEMERMKEKQVSTPVQGQDKRGPRR